MKYFHAKLLDHEITYSREYQSISLELCSLGGIALYSGSLRISRTTPFVALASGLFYNNIEDLFSPKGLNMQQSANLLKGKRIALRTVAYS